MRSLGQAMGQERKKKCGKALFVSLNFKPDYCLYKYMNKGIFGATG